jgi:hypothetical protein
MAESQESIQCLHAACVDRKGGELKYKYFDVFSTDKNDYFNFHRP